MEGALTTPGIVAATVLPSLFMLFRNFSHTLITISCVLFALAGGVIALLLRGYYFNVSAGVGFVSIFGISVMAGVLLVSALNRSSFNRTLTPDLISDTSKDQLRAVLTILILAIFGLVPAATSTGIGSDVQRPLDRKSTRLNSSHVRISYAVFCLKKKINTNTAHIL